MMVDDNSAAAKSKYKRKMYCFCPLGGKTAFNKHTEMYPNDQ